MSKVNYRTACPEDIPDMADLFLLALNDLYSRNGVSAVVPPRPAVLQGYEPIRLTGIFQVAEYEGRIVAIAGAVVRFRCRAKVDQFRPFSQHSFLWTDEAVHSIRTVTLLNEGLIGNLSFNSKEQ